MKKKWFDCTCEAPEHCFRVSCFPDDEEWGGWNQLCISIHLNDTLPWHKRLWYGIRYLFGRKCRYGEFDEILLDPEKVRELKSFLEDYLKDNEAKIERIVDGRKVKTNDAVSNLR